MIHLERMLENIRKVYSDNDSNIYSHIMLVMNAANVKEYVLQEEEEFSLEAVDETVKRIFMDEDGIPHVEVEIEKDGELFEYSLTDDTLNQLDKIQVLQIVIEKFGSSYKIA